MTEQVDKRLALRKLATGLKRMAAEQPGRIIRHNLKNQLRMVVMWRDGEWQLGLWRLGAVPSNMEIEVCRDCFAVPIGAMMSTEKIIADKDPHETRKWRGYVISWEEAARAERPQLAIEETK